MMGLHAFCCGLPLLALLAATVSGATSGVAIFARSTGHFHALLHAHEVWILIASAGFVTAGGVLELNARREASGKGFPVLFALSAACFVLNVAIILAHRAA